MARKLRHVLQNSNERAVCKLPRQSGVTKDMTKKPPKSILDPSFKYRSAASTDVRKTFDRIRRQQRQDERRTQSSEAVPVVVDIASGIRRSA